MRYHPLPPLLGTLATMALIAGPACPTAAATTDDEQIRGVVEDFERSWNAGQLDAWTSLLCRDVRGTEDFSESAFADVREMAGLLALEVTSLEILGDRATAIIEQRGDDADDIAFVREDGTWKWCEPF